MKAHYGQVLAACLAALAVAETAFADTPANIAVEGRGLLHG